MSATSNSSSGMLFKGSSNQNTGRASADSIKKLPESMFKSPLAPAYRRNAVVVSSDAAQSVSSSQSRATTLHSFDLAFGASPSGSYGIGITLDKIGHGPNMGLPIIKEVLPNGSAFAKLACGDVVMSVNGLSLDKSNPLKSTMQIIKGAEDTFVDITVLRFHPAQFNDETLTFRLKRRPLRNLSPLIKRAPILPTTFTSSPHSFAGVNLLTPRFDYPPDPSVEKPSHMIRKQQQPYERMEQFAQSHSPQRQHPPPSAPVTQSLVSDAADSRQQNILQMQYNLALLQMNAMNLPPHQHQELLKLQLQLNHLQQLSLKQQMKTQQLEQEAKPASPGMNPVKSSTSSRSMQPQPWPLPPPRVSSQNTDETLTSRILDASDSNAAEVNVSPLNEEIKEAESGAAPFAPFDADNEAFMKSFLQQEHEVHARESESNDVNVGPLTLHVPFPIAPMHGNTAKFLESDSKPPQVHPSVVNAIDVTRSPAAEIAASRRSPSPRMADDAVLSPHPRGPVSRLLPPSHNLQLTDSRKLFEPHSRTSATALAGAASELIHSSVGSSVEEQTLDVGIAPSDGFVASQRIDQGHRAKSKMHARLGFASGATPAVKSLKSEQELRTALEATRAELAEARRSLRFCMTELVQNRRNGLNSSDNDGNATFASPSKSDGVYPRLDPQWEIDLAFTPARSNLSSVIADSSSMHSPSQATVADGENYLASDTPFRPFKTTALNKTQGGPRMESLSQSGASSTEMQLLNGEIVYLRQRLQMEVLANQELEQIIESACELFTQFNPAASDSLNRSSAMEAFDSIKRTLQDRLFARQQRISALYKTQLV